MISRINIIRLICRFTCASWITHLILYWSEIGWDLVSELGLSVVIVLVTPVGSPLEDSIKMFLGLALGISLGTLEGYLIGVSVGTLGAWWLALEKDIWLAYHWYLQLDPHLNPQILELCWLSHWSVRLLGCGLALKRSGIGVPVDASQIDAKILSGGHVFIEPLPLEILSNIT